MSTKEKYKTIQRQVQTLLVEKKSKFLTDVKPVETEEEALEFLNAIKKKYADARHHVYAYVIDENNIFRYSDDGEPSGTAGMPVLDTIRKEGIVDAIIVVTRYFGGTLLGTGGLVHAYGSSAKLGLLESGIIERVLCDRICVTVDYTLVGKMQYEINSNQYIIENTIYEDEVSFYLCIPIDESEKVISHIVELTNGKVKYKKIDQKYIDLEETA